MGCGSSVGTEEKKRDGGGKSMFPLSLYQKSLIQETWESIEADLLVFGLGTFHKLFKAKPELLNVFPEFGYLDDIDDIKKMSILSGHPKKITQAIREAVKSLDDADIFITKLEALGAKHVENSLKPEYLNALGDAFMMQIQENLREECTKDVWRAWSEFYNFICKLLKQGLAKKNVGKAQVGWF